MPLRSLWWSFSVRWWSEGALYDFPWVIKRSTGTVRWQENQPSKFNTDLRMLKIGSEFRPLPCPVVWQPSSLSSCNHIGNQKLRPSPLIFISFVQEWSSSVVVLFRLRGHSMPHEQIFRPVTYLAPFQSGPSYLSIVTPLCVSTGLLVTRFRYIVIR